MTMKISFAALMLGGALYAATATAATMAPAHTMAPTNSMTPATGGMMAHHLPTPHKHKKPMANTMAPAMAPAANTMAPASNMGGTH